MRERFHDGLGHQTIEQANEGQQLVRAAEEHAAQTRNLADVAKALELERMHRVLRSRQAQAFGGVDIKNPREMKPHEVGGFAREQAAEAHDRRSALAGEISELEKKRDRLKEGLGSAAAEKPREYTPDQRRSKVTRKKAALNEEFKALAKALGRTLTGQGPAQALGGRIGEILYDMFKNRVAHGAVSFADAVLAVSDHVLAARHSDKVHAAMDTAWKRVMAEDPKAEAPGGTAADIIANDPRNSLEKRLERVDKYYKALEEHYQNEHDQLKAMTPEQRGEYLAGEAAKAELPPALQAIKDEGAARIKDLRAKLKELKGGDEAPTLQEEIDAEGRRLANLQDRLEAERTRLSDMSPEQIIAERHDGPSHEVQRLRDEAAEKRAPLLKELQALKNPDAVYKEGATNVPLPPDILAQQKTLGRVERKLRILKDLDAKRFQTVVDKMAARGFPMDDPKAEWLKDPTLIGPFLGALNSITKGGVNPIVAEMYRAGLHMSGSIPLMKVGTDLGQLLVSDVAERTIEGILHGAPREVVEAWRGLGKGLSEGFDAALQSVKYERDRFRDIHPAAGESSDIFAHQHGMTAIPGVLGRGVRFGSGLTPVAALNAFASSVFARLEVGAQAYRRARAEGVPAEKIAEYIQKETADLGSESWAAAARTAARRTFTEPNVVAKGLNKLKTAGLGSKYQLAALPLRAAAHTVFPFTTIPTNVLTQFVFRRAPVLQTIGALYRYYQATHGKTVDGKFEPHNPDFRLSEEMAHHIVTWGTAMALYSTINSADRMGNKRITGFSDKRNPASILFAGHYLSYARFGPAAHMLGSIVDMLQSYKNGTGFAGQAGAIEKHVTSEAWLRSLGDLIEAFHSPNTAARYAANITTAFVPAVAKQAVHAREENVERTTDRADKDFPAAYAEDVRRQMGIGQIPYVSNVWGEPLKKDEFTGYPTTTFLWRVFSPARMGDKLTQEHKIDYLIADYNEKHPAPSDQIQLKPPDSIVWEGKPYPSGEGGYLAGAKVQLSEAQRDEALRIGGGQAKAALTAQMGSKASLTPQDAMVLKTIYDDKINTAKKLIAVRDDPKMSNEARHRAMEAIQKLEVTSPASNLAK